MVHHSITRIFYDVSYGFEAPVPLHLNKGLVLFAVAAIWPFIRHRTTSSIWAEHNPHKRMSLYIFDISFLSSVIVVYLFLWHLRPGGLLVPDLYMEGYLQLSNVCPFGCTCVEVSGKVRPANQLHVTTIFTSTVGSQSLCNRTLIYGVFAFYNCSCRYREFRHRTEVSSLFAWKKVALTRKLIAWSY